MFQVFDLIHNLDFLKIIHTLVIQWREKGPMCVHLKSVVKLSRKSVGLTVMSVLTQDRYIQVANTYFKSRVSVQPSQKCNL